MVNRKRITSVHDRTLASLNINAGSNGDGNALRFSHARRPVKSSSPRNAARWPIVARRRIARRTPLRAFPRDDEIRSALRYRAIALLVFPLCHFLSVFFFAYERLSHPLNKAIGPLIKRWPTLSWREIFRFFIVL